MTGMIAVIITIAALWVAVVYIVLRKVDRQ